MSRHGYDDDDDFDIVDADGWNQFDSYAMRRAPQQPSIHMTQQMTTKVAPAYDGRTSFFAFEDAIDDWRDITELEPEKRGPALRNRLEGGAQQYKKLLDREMLRDPNDGVNYFKRFLRPHFIKGAQSVFLHRLMQLMKYNRGTMDLQKWVTRFQLTGNRLIESWMDLLPDLLITSPEAILYVQQQRQEHEARQAELAKLAAAVPGQEPHVNVTWTDDHSLVAFRQLNENRRQQQRLAFPLGDNLLAAFAETEPARVDALATTYAEQEEHRRTRRGGQNQRDAVAQMNRREAKRFPVLVGDLDALRQGVQRRPAPVPRQVGLQEGEASWKPLAKGTSLFSYGHSVGTEIPSHPEGSVETEESGEQQSAFFISYQAT